jgi:hypothetical protein
MILVNHPGMNLSLEVDVWIAAHRLFQRRVRILIILHEETYPKKYNFQ